MLPKVMPTDVRGIDDMEKQAVVVDCQSLMTCRNGSRDEYFRSQSGCRAFARDFNITCVHRGVLVASSRVPGIGG